MTADALFEYISDILIRCQLDASRLVGMTFDGTMAMKSLAKKAKSEISKSAIFIRCLAHCQEIRCRQTLASLGEAQSLCEDLYVIVGSLQNVGSICQYPG